MLYKIIQGEEGGENRKRVIKNDEKYRYTFSKTKTLTFELLII